MKTTKSILSTLFFLFSLLIQAQEVKHKEITLVNDTSTFKFEVKEGEKITPEPNMVYTWYFKSTISTTTGEYNGMLLDGEYQEYDKNGHLREQGMYKNGGKSGVWKKWSTNGKMTEHSHFKNEQKNQTIVAETRDSVESNSNTAGSKDKKEVAVNGKSEKKTEKMSWSEKKRLFFNKMKYNQEQRKNAKENGDQIRKKNRKEEKYIAVPTSGYIKNTTEVFF